MTARVDTCDGVHDSVDDILACAPCAALLDVLQCPMCGEDVWDGPHGHKLAKCWNSDGHVHGAPLAFD